MCLSQCSSLFFLYCIPSHSTCALPTFAVASSLREVIEQKMEATNQLSEKKILSLNIMEAENLNAHYMYVTIEYHKIAFYERYHLEYSV
jgi:hypothetical protein